jgi:phage gp36-like protein
MYCTLQDLLDRGWERELTQVTDKDRVNELNLVAVEQAIADASADIDGYLQGRYELPLMIEAPCLTRIACDLVRLYLHDKKATEQIQKRYDAAIRYLEQIARGMIKLGNNFTASSVSMNAAEMTSDGNRFGRNHHANY